MKLYFHTITCPLQEVQELYKYVGAQPFQLTTK